MSAPVARPYVQTMTEATGPAFTPLAADAHLLRPLIERAAANPTAPVAAYRRGDEFVDVTAAEFLERVRALAKGLIATGIDEDDRVVLMSHTRLEWLVADYAILAAGGVTVPAYETSSADQLQWIIDDSGAVLTILETPTMKDLYDGFAGETAGCRESIVIDSGELDELAARGDSVDDDVLDARIAGITTDRLATIVYTSGTTGRPKGCALTHANLRTNVVQNIDAIRSMLEPDEVTLLFLPLAHALTKIIALVGMEWGVKLACATDADHLLEEMATVRPTMLVAVPRVFEKVFNKAKHTADEDGHGSIFDKAAAVAVNWSAAQTEHHPRLIVGTEHAILDRLVYRKLQAVFGGHMRFAFSGGGPLGERLTHFFNGIGVKVFEGYGLTETSPTLTVNRSDAWAPGTVGSPLAGTTIRIAPDGEILAKGPQVFAGYWHNDAATAAVFDADGWFRTGDIGELDEHGFLRVTGRKKELIVTAAGKNVAPAPLEDRLRAHPLISQAVVVGDARPFIAAMITLDEEALQEWAAENGRPAQTADTLAEDPALRTTIQHAVDDTNLSVSRAESIRVFRILPRDLSVADGELTPTLKVRRAMVEKSYAHVIEDIYG
jgi:long-chain acyl-CoA synthetase